ncbi:MAG: anthranilate synthase component I [bacterium]
MPSIIPAKDEFFEKAKLGNLIPVYREIIADMETPVSAFKKLGDASFAFLLESVEGGENIGRFSFLGANPQIIFRSKAHDGEIIFSNGRRETFHDAAPLGRLRDLLSRFKFVADPELPPFCGGAVGYMSYDEVKNIETIGSRPADDRNLPDLYFMLTDTLLIFDHVRHRLKILANAHVDGFTPPEAAYEEAVRKIDALHERLRQPLSAAQPSSSSPTPPPLSIDSNFTKDAFEAVVEKCKEYIMAGDIFQVVPSQRFHVTISCDAFEIYRALRVVNPSPYMYYLKFDDLRIAGSSPEILVKVSDGIVQIRPIAGTRRRGQTRQEDAELEVELLADPKERAEHIMLVDLGRNDCGRVCKYGTVRVDDLMAIERYSHVMHIVSNVVGELREGLDAFDVLRAAFPAGTVSGAPKIRAMQIIDEIEPVCRGPYAGTVGYFSFNGSLDSCITIRTVVMQGNEAYIQAGGGIVADSVPAAEYQETVNKATGMLRAIEMAECGMD